MSNYGGRLEVAGGEVFFWVEQGTSIHLKAITEFGDPVELTFEEAIMLGSQLERLAREASESSQTSE